MIWSLKYEKKCLLENVNVWLFGGKWSFYVLILNHWSVVSVVSDKLFLENILSPVRSELFLLGNWFLILEFVDLFTLNLSNFCLIKLRVFIRLRFKAWISLNFFSFGGLLFIFLKNINCSLFGSVFLFLLDFLFVFQLDFFRL